MMDLRPGLIAAAIAFVTTSPSWGFLHHAVELKPLHIQDHGNCSMGVRAADDQCPSSDRALPLHDEANTILRK